jgi:hypothetical protein
MTLSSALPQEGFDHTIFAHICGVFTPVVESLENVDHLIPGKPHVGESASPDK